MIDKIHFSLNVFIYSINMIICILYYNERCIDLTDSNLSKEFITLIEEFNSIALGYSIFLLLYSLIFIVIYQEVYGNDILKDIFINSFYLILICAMMYNNYKILDVVKNEEEKYISLFLDVPSFQLDKMTSIFHYNQGLFFLLIVLTIIKGFVTFYRVAKNFIVSYFQNGGNIFYFETSQIIS